MKKIFTLALLAVASLSASAQEYNLFDAADVDADGWLWFNTQEKIDKYVGTIDEDNYTVNPNGKIIQMGFANITPDYPETVADPDVTGADSQGYLFADEGVNKDELIKGAIILAPASAQSSMNGGCLILNLPSCATINLLLSSEARMMGRTLMVSPGFDMSQDDSTGDDPWTGHTKAIYARASVFGSIHGAGQYKWEGIESLNNGYNEGVSFVSDGPVYFALQNCHKYPIYVHAIKVTTPKQESAGVRVLSADAAAKAPVYNLAGQRTAAPAHGLFIQGGKKLVIK
jgi:hypothetical protein